MKGIRVVGCSAVLAACFGVAASVGGTKSCAANAPSAEKQQTSALLQSRKITAKAALKGDDAVSDEMGDLGVPKNLEPELMQLAKDEHNSGRTTVSSKQWLDLKHAYTGYTTGPHDAPKVFDGNYNTWGGGAVWTFDLGRQYLVDTMSIDWYVCQCDTAGSVEIGGSSDMKTWTVWTKPTLNAWGKSVKKTYHFQKSARYITIKPTSKANPQWVGFYEIKVYAAADQTGPNIYGWYHSYKAGNGGLSGTEIVHLFPYKGKLFGGTGYWKAVGAFRPAEIVRLDCPLCEWVLESPIAPYAGRVESLKSVTWTTDKDGAKLSSPVEALMGGFYMDMTGEGQCHIVRRDDATKEWKDSVYWRRTPFDTNYLSARAFVLYHDPVTKTDGLFLSSGMDGIVRGTYKASNPSLAHFDSNTESGKVETRPLALTICDGRLYFTASSYIQRRINGQSPKWEKVFDMAEHDTSGTVDEAVGGIRGISTITNPGIAAGESLLFAWAPNAASEGCMIRLDPDGDSFKWTEEACTRQVEKDYLGTNKDNLEALVTFVIANYNAVLEVPKPSGGVVHLIGFQVLMYAYSYHEMATDPVQTLSCSSGKPLSYFAGSGYLIRRSANDYEARTPGGPRWDPMAIFPKQVAVRALSTSPFGDGAVFVGGYDCNHFDAKDTAWVQRGTAEAVFDKPVPCQPELGCGHTWGEKYKMHGCDWCDSGSGGVLKLADVAAWRGKTPLLCQTLVDWLNSPAGKSHCTAAKSWDARKKCCRLSCNLCTNGGTFDSTRTAGSYGDGSKYSCQVAKDYVENNPGECTSAASWWGSACCL
mmetsp:Transcript_78412/g.243157  ORF Transcript_78412/g.243157 Transcript_78412/m.243157 type:complete len:813 (+) Transcript_78412:46-2484(+)